MSISNTCRDACTICIHGKTIVNWIVIADAHAVLVLNGIIIITSNITTAFHLYLVVVIVVVIILFFFVSTFFPIICFTITVVTWCYDGMLFWFCVLCRWGLAYFGLLWTKHAFSDGPDYLTQDQNAKKVSRQKGSNFRLVFISVVYDEKTQWLIRWKLWCLLIVTVVVVVTILLIIITNIIVVANTCVDHRRSSICHAFCKAV